MRSVARILPRPALIALWVTLAGTWFVAAGAETLSAPSLWVADGKTLTNLDPVGGNARVVVSIKPNATRLAVEPSDGAVWVLSHDALEKYGATGTLLLARNTKEIDKGLGNAAHLELDPYDGSVWIAGKTTLARLNAQGEKFAQVTVPSEVLDVGLDLDESLWVLAKNELAHFSREGARLAAIPLPAEITSPDLLAVGSLGGAIWVAEKGHLARFESTDLATAAKIIPLPDLPKPQGGDNSVQSGQVQAIAVHPVFGSLWVLTGDYLLIFTADGSLSKQVALSASTIKNADKLVFEPAGLTLWVTGHDRIGHFTTTGALLSTIPIKNKVEAIGVAPFRLLPTLRLIAPPDGRLTNDPQPTIRFEAGADCSGLACLLVPSYYATQQLDATLNGLRIGDQFQNDGAEFRYTPFSRLPEGQSALSALTTDLFGHQSNRVTSVFTIDTIAPKFIELSPSDNSVLTAPDTVVQGLLDDPDANVLLADSQGNVLGMGGARFSFPVTLKAGLNAFTLTARDPAGNDTRTSLTLRLSAISVKIEDPATGARVAGGRVLMSGHLLGPSNTGVAINGVLAHVAGERFIAEVPVSTGANQLTAVATSPNGLTATDSITINVEPGAATAGAFEITPAVGVAPVLVRLRPATDTPWLYLNVDFDGNGTTDGRATYPEQSIDFTYTVLGIYRAAVTATDFAGRAVNQTVLVVVHDAKQTDDFFTGLWSGMNAALVRGDVSAALAFLSDGAKPVYTPVFEALLPHMREIVASQSALARVAVTENVAEYAVVRPDRGEKRAYLIYFLRDGNGVWRLDSL